MGSEAPSYRGFRFPPEVIAHAVWLYHRFRLSLRDVEELLFERGIQVSYEAIRLWCDRFGPAYAARLRRRRPKPGDRWHLDEGHCHRSVLVLGGAHRGGRCPQLDW